VPTMPGVARVIHGGLSLLLVVGLVVSVGCSSPVSRESAPQPPASAQFEPSPCPRTREPTPSLETASCGYLVVPENRAIPNGRTIRLAVAIVPATTPTPAPEPVVYLAGGPGEDAIQGAKYVIDAELNRERDLILVSQRGTYSSQPALTCAEIDEFRARNVGLVYYASSTKQEHVEVTQACHRRLAATGADLSAYNTSENAADLADLRTALDIDQWNVYGVSYGSDLALTYMRQHPEGIRAVTIDGVVPPDMVTPGWFWSSVREAFARSIRQRVPRL
jgi:pimeloyl-ACP methyl ester carboxylesterase